MVTDEMWLQGMENLQQIADSVQGLLAFCVLLGILIVVIALFWLLDKVIFKDV